MSRKDEKIIDVDFEKYKGKIKIGVWAVVIAIFAIVMLCNVFYKIEDGEAGVKMRFGLVLGVEKQPGIHIKIPFVETVKKVDVSKVSSMELGYRSLSEGTTTSAPTYKDEMNEAMVIVDGANDNASIALINLIIEYKIENPIDYLYNVDDVEGTLRLALEEEVRNSAQRLTLDEAKTNKDKIDNEVKPKLQQKMDQFGAGILIVSVKTQNVEFMESVEIAYQEKENANQYKNGKLEEAEKYKNIIIPKAQAEATALLEEANSYKLDKIAEARAEMAIFNAIYEEYKANPEIIKEKYFLESMRELLTNNEIVIDTTNGESIYKFYNMDGNPANQVKENIVN